MGANPGELYDAALASLRGSGRYDQIKGEMRKELFQLLTKDGGDSSPASREAFVINELILEYLQFNGYTNSLSVFMRETGQPDEPMNRDFLAQCIDVVPHRMIPILYTLTTTPDQPNEDHSEEIRRSVVDDGDSGFFEISAI
jgi:lisH domain-containing protein FOPNL